MSIRKQHIIAMNVKSHSNESITWSVTLRMFTWKLNVAAKFVARGSLDKIPWKGTKNLARKNMKKRENKECEKEMNVMTWHWSWNVKYKFEMLVNADVLRLCVSRIWAKYGRTIISMWSVMWEEEWCSYLTKNNKREFEMLVNAESSRETPWQA